MKKINIANIFILAIAIAFCVMFTGCDNVNNITDNSNKSETTSSVYTFKKMYDEKMKNAKNPKKLASVNGDIIINQVDVDMFKENHPNKTLDTVILYNVLSLEAQDNGVEISSYNRDRIYNMLNGIRIDQEFSEEYCQTTYGITKEEVIQYEERRLNLINFYNEMLLKFNADLKSGQLQEDYPELKKMCEKYKEKDEAVDSQIAYNNLKAYHDKIFDEYGEILKEKYNVKIY